MERKILLCSAPKRLVVAAATVVSLMSALNAQAGGTITFGEDKSIGFGLEMRESYTSTKNGSPSGTSRSSDFNLDSISLKVSSSLNKNIKSYFSTDIDGAGNVKMKDAYAQFDITPEFNILAGRVLPPTDRANLAGPYYALSWSFPGVVSQYPGIAFGRDNGVVAWGKLIENKVVYSAGVFQGRNRVGATASNQDAKSLFAGRIAVNLWDAEPAPVYYTGSTYFGAADIFTVGLVAQTQKDGVGTIGTKDDYKAWNVDTLIEKKLSIGVMTLDGAYYKYSFSPAAAIADGGVTPGKAMLLGGGFLFPTKMGWGQFQPYLRYQKFEAEGTGAQTKQTDIGLNYIIDGSSAKLSGTYTKSEQTALASTNQFVLGLQLQF